MTRQRLLRELVLLGLLGLLASSCTWNDGTITDVQWEQTPRGGPFLEGNVVGDAVHVESRPGGQTFTLIRMGFSSAVNPATYADGVAVVGDVEYRDVEGTGYLQMTTYQGGHRVSVTRTLDDSGVGSALTGSSDWRDFRLACSPASVNSFSPMTMGIEIDVVLAGSGSVDVGPLRIGTLTMGPRGWLDGRTD